MAKWKTRNCQYLNGLTVFHLDHLGEIDPMKECESPEEWAAHLMKRAICALLDFGLEEGYIAQVFLHQYCYERKGDKFGVAYAIQGMRGFGWSITTDLLVDEVKNKSWLVGDFEWGEGQITHKRF